jgi:hypothetical protein
MEYRLLVPAVLVQGSYQALTPKGRMTYLPGKGRYGLNCGYLQRELTLVNPLMKLELFEEEF